LKTVPVNLILLNCDIIFDSKGLML